MIAPVSNPAQLLYISRASKNGIASYWHLQVYIILVALSILLDHLDPMWLTPSSKTITGYLIPSFTARVGIKLADATRYTGSVHYLDPFWQLVFTNWSRRSNTRRPIPDRTSTKMRRRSLTRKEISTVQVSALWVPANRRLRQPVILGLSAETCLVATGEKRSHLSRPNRTHLEARLQSPPWSGEARRLYQQFAPKRRSRLPLVIAMVTATQMTLFMAVNTIATPLKKTRPSRPWPFIWNRDVPDRFGCWGREGSPSFSTPRLSYNNQATQPSCP